MADAAGGHPRGELVPEPGKKARPKPGKEVLLMGMQVAGADPGTLRTYLRQGFHFSVAGVCAEILSRQPTYLCSINDLRISLRIHLHRERIVRGKPGQREVILLRSRTLGPF